MSEPSISDLPAFISKQKRLLSTVAIGVFLCALLLVSGSLDPSAASRSGPLDNLSSDAAVLKGMSVLGRSRSAYALASSARRVVQLGPAFNRAAKDINVTLDEIEYKLKRLLVSHPQRSGASFDSGAVTLVPFTFEQYGTAADQYENTQSGTRTHKRMARCRKQHRYRYWNHQKQRCVFYPGINSRLSEWEVSESELSCSPDSAFARYYSELNEIKNSDHHSDVGGKNAHKSTAVHVATSLQHRKRHFGWKKFAFSSYFPVDSTLRQLGVDLEPLNAAAVSLPSFNSDAAASNSSSSVFISQLERRYARFVFFSSWLFRQYLPFTPLPLPLSPADIQERQVLNAAGGIASDPQHPAASPGTASSSSSATFSAAFAKRHAFSAFHDGGTENIYRLQNVCVSPTRGLWGFSAGGRKREQYRGKDDTSSVFHGEAPWPAFLNNVADLASLIRGKSAMPVAFDKRPLFFNFANPLARHNMAHISFRLFALVATLDLPAFSLSSSSSSSSAANPQHPRRAAGQSAVKGEYAEEEEEEGEFVPRTGTSHWTESTGVKPLLVFVFAPQPPNLDKWKEDTKKTTAWAFLLRVLDLPWASVTTPGTADDRRYMKELYTLTRHLAATLDAPAVSEAAASSHNVSFEPTTTTPSTADGNLTATGGAAGEGDHQHAEEEETNQPTLLKFQQQPGDANSLMFQSENVEDELFCSREAVAWSACVHSCGTSGHAVEEYSWTMFQLPNRQRARAVHRYIELANHCVPQSDESTALVSSSPLLHRLPKLFILLRTRTRSFAFFSYIFDRLRRELNGTFVSDIVVREQGVGSRAQYVRDLRSADILLVSHGGSEADLVLLKRLATKQQQQHTPVIVEFQVPNYGCDRNIGGVEEGRTCWFGPLSQIINANHHVVQLRGAESGSKEEQSLWVPSFIMIDSIRAATCNFFHANPKRAPAMTRTLSLFCKHIIGARRFKSMSVTELDQWPAVDADELLSVLRVQFAVIVTREAAVTRLIPALLSLRSAPPSVSAPKGTSEYVLYLESDAPALFHELIQRFVGPSLVVNTIVHTRDSRATVQVASGGRVIASGSRIMQLADLCCLTSDQQQQQQQQPQIANKLCLRVAWLPKKKNM